MSEKRKSGGRLSSSSEEDEVLLGHDVTSSHKGVKKSKKQRRSADERENLTSSDSQSSPRKRFDRFKRTKPIMQSPDSEKIYCAESNSDCAPVKFSEAEPNTSKNEKPVQGCESMEQTPPKLTSTKHGHRKSSKAKSRKASSRHRSSRSRKQRGASTLLPVEEKEQKQHEKMKCKPEEPLWTGNYSSAIRIKACPSASSEDAAEQNREELIKKNSRRHHTKVREDKKSSSPDTKHASYFSTKKSSIVERHTASGNSSKGLKKPTSISGIVKSDLQKTSESLSTQKQTHSLIPTTSLHFKIPKKILQKSVDENNYDASPNTNVKHETKLPDCEVVAVDSNQETVDQAQSCLDATPHCSYKGHDSRPSASSSLQSPVDTNTDTSDDQMHVVQQLYLARSQRRLQVNVLESYGELTCMDIDSPEEGSTYMEYKQPQQGLIVVLDTNILLSHLKYVEKISSEGLKALGFPCILIPWVVLQELDSLKKGRGLSGSVAHLAIPAISFIYNSLRSRKPQFLGQSMQQAAERSGLNAENNDDRVLQCCLQYQSLYPECALILCTNDKNLCCKALLSGVKALNKDDLEAKAERSQHDNTQLCKADEDWTTWDLPRCISVLEQCLHDVLSDVLEAEMKSIYQDLWTEIVYQKPPWTLKDVLKCYNKHWIAVFRYILPSSSLETVMNLINFFKSGDNKDHTTTSKVLIEARNLVEKLQERSNHVRRVLCVMDKIFKKLHHQEPCQLVEGESSTLDVVMNDDDGSGTRDEGKGGKQSSAPQVSHQEVWAMFDSIWTIVFQTSTDMFKSLGFDAHTMQSAQPAGDCRPPQDALVCLHKLSTTISQLLQGFSSVLSLSSSMEEVETLLSVIHSYKVAGWNSSVTAKHLLDCFLQPEYREKLQLGGRQLMDLQDTVNCCIQANTRTFTS